jgi:hypothetical protein
VSLRLDLTRQFHEPVLAPCDQRDAVALVGQQTRDLRADAGGGSRHDGGRVLGWRREGHAVRGYRRPVRLRGMTRFCALALALALVLAACGSDEDNADGGSQPRTSDQAQTAAHESPTTSKTDAEPGASDNRKDGDDDAQSSDRDGPSLAEYIRGADRICRRAQLAIARRGSEYRDLAKAFSRGKISREEFLQRGGELTERSGEIAQRAVADLKELPPPTSRREAIEAYLQGATTQADILAAQGRASQQGRNDEIAKLNRRIAQAGQKTRSAARRVGFRICGGA